jgi:hypothetical protein
LSVSHENELLFILSSIVEKEFVALIIYFFAKYAYAQGSCPLVHPL